MPRSGTASPESRPTSPPEILLSVPAVAERLSVSVRQTWRLISQGHIPVVRLGGSTRVREAALNHYILSLAHDPFRPGPPDSPETDPED